MKKLTKCLALLALLWGTMPAHAGSLPQADRRIGKEPAYRGKPSYYLLVFGQEAKTRVWLVLDGDTLYVDRNANGDLTEPGERIGGDRSGDGSLRFRIPDLTESDGRTKHVAIHIDVTPSKMGKPGSVTVSVKIKGTYREYTTIEADEWSAARPETAPVRHFHGPLRMWLVATDKQVFVRTGQPRDLTVVIGTLFDKGWTFVDHGDGESGQGIPAEVHPLAEIAFPAEEAGAPPIQIRVPLKQRC